TISVIRGSPRSRNVYGGKWSRIYGWDCRESSEPHPLSARPAGLATSSRWGSTARRVHVWLPSFRHGPEAAAEGLLCQRPPQAVWPKLGGKTGPGRGLPTKTG